MRNHEKAFSDIKNYYNDITLNNLALINSLKVRMCTAAVCVSVCEGGVVYSVWPWHVHMERASKKFYLQWFDCFTGCSSIHLWNINVVGSQSIF